MLPDDLKREAPALPGERNSKNLDRGLNSSEDTDSQQNFKPDERPEPDFAAQMARSEFGHFQRQVSPIYRQYKSRDWEVETSPVVLETRARAL